jgi:hypothetical protein
MVNRVQANVAPLKVQGSIWPVCREWSLLAPFAGSAYPLCGGVRPLRADREGQQRVDLTPFAKSSSYVRFLRI